MVVHLRIKMTNGRKRPALPHGFETENFAELSSTIFNVIYRRGFAKRPDLVHLLTKAEARGHKL
jgi:hypothetical protein